MIYSLVFMNYVFRVQLFRRENNIFCKFWRSKGFWTFWQLVQKICNLSRRLATFWGYATFFRPFGTFLDALQQFYTIYNLSRRFATCLDYLERFRTTLNVFEKTFLRISKAFSRISRTFLRISRTFLNYTERFHVTLECPIDYQKFFLDYLI